MNEIMAKQDRIRELKNEVMVINMSGEYNRVKFYAPMIHKIKLIIQLEKEIKDFLNF